MKFYFIKITVRNALRNGTLSFAKLFGLSISFAVILFAVGYVYFETSFDKSVPGYDRIYRCLMEGKLNNEDVSFAVTSPEMAGKILADMPEVNEVMRFMAGGEVTITIDREKYNGGNLIYADPQFFSFFSIPLTKNTGDPLGQFNNIVVAQSLAEKFFKSVDKALNKTIRIGNDDYTITGVFRDLPRNFHIQPKLILSILNTAPDKVGWDSQNYYTYLKTNQPISDLDAFSFMLTKMVYRYDKDENINADKAKTWDDLKYSPEIYIFYNAEPLTSIHFSIHKFDPAVISNKLYVYGAVVLALLILLISSINYINLTIANISTRFKVLGIQKTNGARTRLIVQQFLAESFLFICVGFILAVFIYQLAEIPLKKYLNLDVALSNFGLLKITVLAFCILVTFNLAIQVIPVIIITKKKILNLLKEEKTSKRGLSVSNYFVFFQFILSGLIILGSIMVQKQINYLVHKDRGYDVDNVMMLTMWEMHPEKRRSFINDLKTYDAVLSVSTSDRYFGMDPGMTAAFFGTTEGENYFHTTLLPVDDEFFKTFNFRLKEGRFFEKDHKTDTASIIINEAAVKEYKGTGSLIGHDIIINGKKYTVIGIVKDFNFRSLHYPVQPIVISRVDNFGNVYVKIKNDRIAEVTGIIDGLWKKYDISFPFTWRYHDEIVAEHYVKDQQAKRLLMILSMISIAIACVGLYAISFFRITRRTKEIGIRKVNGAGISEVVIMLNKDFLKLVAAAFCLSCPIAWFAIDKWLENFAYKTPLSLWVFIVAGFLTLFAAWVAISWQTWRAATRNPIEALRYE